LLVAAIAEAVVGGDHGQVVFLVVGAEVFAARPLDEQLIVADAHDRGPAGFAAAVAFIIAFGRRAAAVVEQAEGVADFMRAGFRDVAGGV